MLDYKHWKTRCKDQTALYNAFNKYGEDLVIVEILCSGKDITLEERNSLEIRYIAEYNTQTPNGYNIEAGGNYYSNYKLNIKIPIECIEDLNQSIKDLEHIYSGIIDWVKENTVEDIYKLLDYPRFIHLELVTLKFGNWFPEEKYTLLEVIDGEVVQYILLPNSINEDNLDPKDKLIYIAIRRYADNKTLIAYPSYAKITNDTGAAAKTIKKCVDKLEAAGYIKVEKHDGDRKLYYHFNNQKYFEAYSYDFLDKKI